MYGKWKWMSEGQARREICFSLYLEFETCEYISYSTIKHQIEYYTPHFLSLDTADILGWLLLVGGLSCAL